MKKVLLLMFFTPAVYCQVDCGDSPLPIAPQLEIIIIDNQDESPNDGAALFTYEHIFEPVLELNPDIDFELTVSSVGWFEPVTPLPALITGGGYTYYYKVKNVLTGCEGVNIAHLTVQTPVANIDENSLSSLQYANPINEVLSIKNTNKINSISIFNSSGQIVYNQAINNESIEIDLTGVNSGIYFVNLSAEKASKTIKIVKQ
ncbi:MAG: hypothetical protein DI539_00820 [Flavobacterium psychrophilum]|nr:MAG: hypothetical protein DI539_00820 [Flavobacterium psychrophilum]